MSFEKVRRLRVSISNIIKGYQSENKTEETEESVSVIDDNQICHMTPMVISYYSDFSDNKYYENFANILIGKCKGFNLIYDINELQSRGNYGVNCLMKPEFILSKIKQYKKPLIWMDCDTNFREPFPHFNEVKEDIGMATHSGELDGIKASPLYFNYTKGAFRIIREWVVHCRACYDKGIVELDHDALKHYVLDFLKGTYSTYLLTDNWNDFVHGRYIWNGNSRVEGKVQIHKRVGVSDDIRRTYSSDVRYIKLFFESNDESVFKTALNFLNKFSDRSRISFNFLPSLLHKTKENPIYKSLEIESGGLVYFDDVNFETAHMGKTDVLIYIKDVSDIENEWDLKILSLVDGQINPLYELNFIDNGKGQIKIKTPNKIWI